MTEKKETSQFSKMWIGIKNQSKAIQFLTLTKNELQIEKEKLEIEKNKLEAEKEKLELEKKNFEAEKQKLRQARSRLNRNKKILEEENVKIAADWDEINEQKEQIKVIKDEIINDKNSIENDIDDLKKQRENLSIESNQLKSLKIKLEHDKNLAEEEKNHLAAEKGSIQMQRFIVAGKKRQLEQEKKSLAEEESKIETRKVLIEDKLSKIKEKQDYNNKGKEEDSIGNLYVNYQLTIPESKEKYSILRIPKKGCIIRSHRFGKSKRRGFKEVELQQHIEFYFGSHFLVSGEVRLNTGDGARPFEPDIAIIDKEIIKNIRIDIEIDEPYDGISRNPTHCYTNDSNRDNFFIERGWIVIRFSEYQVHTQIFSCLKFIAQIINKIEPKFIIPSDLEIIPDLVTENTWSEIQAKKWANENYREKYLNHKFGINLEEDTYVDTDLNEQEKAEESKVLYALVDKIAEKRAKNANIAEGIFRNMFEGTSTESKKNKDDNIQPEEPIYDIEKGYFIDKRDGIKYKIKQIGDQVWFDQNLSYKTTKGSWAYDNKEGYVSNHGRLYNWDSLQSAIPEGWHIPSDEEWKQLELNLGINRSEINNTKWRSFSNKKGSSDLVDTHLNTNMINKTTLASIFSGSRTNNSFSSINNSSFYWTSTEGNSKLAWVRIFSESIGKICRSQRDKNDALSVRCIKD